MKDANSFISVGKDQQILPNTHCLFVRKATVIVNSHAIIVLITIDRFNMFAKI